MSTARVWGAAGVLACALFGGGFGAGRWTLEGRRGASDRSAVVVSFAGGTVTADEVRAALGEQGPLLRGRATSDESRRRVAVELARQKLLEQAARAKGYDQAPEILREQRRAIVALYLHRELDEPESKRPPTDDEMRAFLDRHKAEYERPERVRIADLFIAAAPSGPARKQKAAEAEALLGRLRRSLHDHYAFATLARQRSDDAATRAFGGDLPLSTRAELTSRMGPEIADAAFALRGAGILADRVVETPQGFHLLKLQAREEATTADVNGLRALLRPRLLAERRTQAEQRFYAALEAGAGLRVDDAALAALAREGTARAER